MCDQTVRAVVEEIRDLHSRQCELADRLRSVTFEEEKQLIQKCTARPSPGFPELDHFKSVFDRQDALRRVRENPVIQRRMNRFQMVSWVVLFVACLRLQFYTNSTLVLFVVVLVFGSLLMYVSQCLWMRKALRRALRELLVQRGVPLCLACGYDLRGQIAPRCPECGAAADAGVTVAAKGVNRVQ